MNMTKGQRKDLARRVEDKRLSDYGGNRRAAYTDAKVNSATWTKAEKGEVIAERSYVAIIGTLWPETQGDWRRMDPPLTGLPDDDASWRDYVASLNLSPEVEASVIAAIEADRAAKESDAG